MQHARGERVRGEGRPARRVSASYKILLCLILLNIVAAGFGDFHPVLRSAYLWLGAATLALALHASRASRKILLIVVPLALVAAALWKPAQAHHKTSEFLVVAVFNLLTALAPIAILGRVRREFSAEGVDAEVVLGALCAYLYIGNWFAVIYRSTATLGNAPFFAQPGSETMLNYVYFSFVTLTTTGFGDLSPAYGPGRMFAAVEAVIGQLYLVSVVAIVVSAFRKPR